VPVCFALVGDGGDERGPERIVSAVDHKPKTTTALARLADITRTGHATLLVDHYDDEHWDDLWWVRVSGRATVLAEGDDADRRARAALEARYRQYRDHPPRGPVWEIALDEVTGWRASAGPAGPSPP
jgi:PPOX class probable F420-dependent enzyme